MVRGHNVRTEVGMSSTLLIVLAHQQVQGIFNHHLPLWERMGMDLVVLTPKDAPIVHRNRLMMGKAGYADPNMAERAWRLLQFCSTLNYDGYVICEYDSFCLSKSVPLISGFNGIYVRSTDPPGRFIADAYLLPPWTIDRDTASRMLNVAVRSSYIYEGGWTDRLFAAWAQRAGIGLGGLRGFGADTIRMDRHEEQLNDALRKGAKWIHGVKDDAALKYLEPWLCES